MKLKELLEKHQDLELTEEQEKEIKKFLNINDNRRWKPKESQHYYFVDSGGTICKNIFIEKNESVKFRYFTNNVFKTEEETKFRLEQIKVYNELKNFADENNDEIDWKNKNKLKFYIYCVPSSNTLAISTVSAMRDIGQIYFSSKELALQAIEKIGEDRIKKYLFNIREESK